MTKPELLNELTATTALIRIVSAEVEARQRTERLEVLAREAETAWEGKSFSVFHRKTNSNLKRLSAEARTAYVDAQIESDILYIKVREAVEAYKALSYVEPEKIDNPKEA